jgi:hypothetical protein
MPCIFCVWERDILWESCLCCFRCSTAQCFSQLANLYVKNLMGKANTFEPTLCLIWHDGYYSQHPFHYPFSLLSILGTSFFRSLLSCWALVAAWDLRCQPHRISDPGICVGCSLFFWAECWTKHARCSQLQTISLLRIGKTLVSAPGEKRTDRVSPILSRSGGSGPLFPATITRSAMLGAGGSLPTTSARRGSHYAQVHVRLSDGLGSWAHIFASSL